LEKFGKSQEICLKKFIRLEIRINGELFLIKNDKVIANLW